MALATAGFTLGVRPVSSLRPHEDTIPRHVKELAQEITRDGVQKDPIIIDRESATVLDGMHRLAAFQELKIENAVCCAVHYSSRAIALGRWARVYKPRQSDGVDDALGSLPSARRTTLAEAFSALERRETALAVLTSDAAYLVGRPHLEEVRAVIASFDRISERLGWERRFVPEDDIDLELQERRKFVLLPRKLMKDDVVAAARSGKLLPCKTSMHMVDPRPVSVRFPIEALGAAGGEALRLRLNGGKGRLFPPGSTYEGRRYKERLLFLDQG
ncbi:MAG: ParB N-terminal domain-containing protein [Nitrososphaerota archaeon]|nr:ParB N-terminal domain-containing protein [Nitrososphaerota archaeon]MDG6947668.1 ParB N-terminal domain-containing protein [Nitrososphaerota archaeon]